MLKKIIGLSALCALCLTVYFFGFLKKPPVLKPSQIQAATSASENEGGEVDNNILTLDKLSLLDKSKPTVCNITINSADEKEIFNKYLKKDFNIVELIDEENENWFEDSCKSGLQCDILIVSGHFGGSFFGKSRHRLSATKIENMSCKKSCAGILRKPKEVFLFGCNTTAGKEADSRTAAEYADILYNEHRDVYRTRELAELHAALRYSPVGTQTQDKMRRSFPNAKIYGFSSVAPSGKNIRGSLQKYFNLIKNYSSNLIGNVSHENTWEKLMRLNYNIRTVDGIGDRESPICILGSSKPINKKLMWIESVFKETNGVLTYAPNVNEYLVELERRFGSNWDKWPKVEVSVLEKLQFNLKAKSTVAEFLKTPIPGILTVQFQVLNMGKRLGWFNINEVRKIEKTLIGDVFAQNLDIESKDKICSLNVKMNLTLDDLPKDKWNTYTLAAIGCVAPEDEGVHFELGNLLKSKNKSDDEDGVLSILEAFKGLKIKSKEIQLILADVLLYDDYNLHTPAGDALARAVNVDNEVVNLMLSRLNNKNGYAEPGILYALSKMNSLPRSVIIPVSKLIDSEAYEVAATAFAILSKFKIDDDEIFEKLTKLFKSDDEEIRIEAAITVTTSFDLKEERLSKIWSLVEGDDYNAQYVAFEMVLIHVKPFTEKMHLRAAKLLKNDKISWTVSSSIGQPRPLKGKVLDYIISLIDEKSEDTRLAAVRALGTIVDPDLKTVLTLIKAPQKNSEQSFVAAVSSALNNFKIKNTKVVDELLELMDSPEAIIRAGALNALKGAVKIRKDVFVKTLDSLKDESIDVKYLAVGALSLYKTKSPEMFVALINALWVAIQKKESFLGELIVGELSGVKLGENKLIDSKLLEMSKSSSPSLRQAAVSLLASTENYQHKAVKEFFINALKDSDETVRILVINAFKLLKPNEERVHIAMSEFLDQAENSKDLREEILFVLGDLNITNKKVVDKIRKYEKKYFSE